MSIELEETDRSQNDIELDKKYRAFLEKQAALEPNNVHVLVQLAVIAWEPFEEESVCMAYLERALDKEPENVEVLFWLAKFLYEQGKYEEAKSHVLKALEVAPNKPECLGLLGEILNLTVDDPGEAITCFDRALQFAPDWPSLWLSLGLVYLRASHVLYAEQHFQMVKELALCLQIPMHNAFERYYEMVVTGRNNPHMVEKMNYWKYRIEKSRL